MQCRNAVIDTLKLTNTAELKNCFVDDIK